MITATELTKQIHDLNPNVECYLKDHEHIGCTGFVKLNSAVVYVDTVSEDEALYYSLKPQSRWATYEDDKHVATGIMSSLIDFQ